jgi:hypothetical protein
MTPKPTTDEAESLPPLPRPFMEKFGRVSPEVYDPWAAQMRTYALQAIASLKAPAADEATPFWYAIVSKRAPVINTTAKRLDVAHEIADKHRPNWPDVEVIPLYTLPHPPKEKT